jgi:hypothetical protein
MQPSLSTDLDGPMTGQFVVRKLMIPLRDAVARDVRGIIGQSYAEVYWFHWLRLLNPQLRFCLICYGIWST